MTRKLRYRPSIFDLEHSKRSASPVGHIAIPSEASLRPFMKLCQSLLSRSPTKDLVQSLVQEQTVLETERTRLLFSSVIVGALETESAWVSHVTARTRMMTRKTRSKMKRS